MGCGSGDGFTIRLSRFEICNYDAFLDQEKNWNEAKQEKYEMILAQADFVTSLTKRPYEAPWQFIEKNEFFLKNSDGYSLFMMMKMRALRNTLKSWLSNMRTRMNMRFFLLTLTICK